MKKEPTTNPLSPSLASWRLGVQFLFLIAGATLLAQTTRAIYECDFQNAEPGKVPDDFKVLKGEFSVQSEGENRFLELAADPVNAFGVLLGPERGADTSIRAQLRGWPSGKRNPEFGIGLGGTRGYQFWLMPAVNELQIRRDNQVVARAPFTWKAGQWIQMSLEVRSIGQGRWRISGGTALNNDAGIGLSGISQELTEQPPTGRASLWGTPYSEKPIQFDDVRIEGK
jgi:hypothetical protein